MFKQILIKAMNDHLAEYDMADSTKVIDIHIRVDCSGYDIELELKPHGWQHELGTIYWLLKVEADTSLSEVLERVLHAKWLFMFGTY